MKMRWIAIAALAVSVPQDRATFGQEPAWEEVGRILGKVGKLLPDGTYRIDVPRSEPQLRNEFGFVVPPSMVITYAAFAGVPSDATVVGDTCMLGEEVNPVVDALRAA